MKIAHITSLHPQNDNRIFYKECTTLVDNGYDITLIVAGGESQILNGVKIIAYEKADGGRIKRMIKTSFFDMIKICKKVDADVYHFHDPELMFVGLYLKMKGKRVIYDIHENNPASILSKPYIKSKILRVTLSKTFNFFEQSCSKFFDALVTARPDITKRFKHKNIVTLRNFPILPDFSKIKNITIEKTKPAVIYVGGMHELRGTDKLLDAFEKLDKYELWLLGGIRGDALQKRIEAGVKNVRYFGMVEAFEVFAYIDKADAGIITFFPLENHVQTLATKPFEYMACGKPMIMSDFPYWRDTFKESSFYVDPENVVEIVTKVEELLENKELLEKMKKINQKLAQEEYNWEKESQYLLDLYKGLNIVDG